MNWTVFGHHSPVDLFQSDEVKFGIMDIAPLLARPPVRRVTHWLVKSDAAGFKRFRVIIHKTHHAALGMTVHRAGRQSKPVWIGGSAWRNERTAPINPTFLVGGRVLHPVVGIGIGHGCGSSVVRISVVNVEVGRAT